MNPFDLLATQTGGRVVHCKLNTPEYGTLSTVSSSSSLIDLASVANLNTNSGDLKQSSAQFRQQSNVSDEVVNYYSEIHSTDSHKANLPTFLVCNVSYKKSNNYAFLLTMNGEIFFFKMLNNANYPIKQPIWHQTLNVIVMRYFKLDIDVSFLAIKFFLHPV